MPHDKKRALRAGPAASIAPDLTNSLAIAFYAAIWTVAAALVTIVFFK